MARYEDDMDTAAPAGSSMLPWLVAVIAVGLGGVAAYHFSNQRDQAFAQIKKAQDDASSAKAKLAAAEEARGSLEKQVNDLQSSKKLLETTNADLRAKVEDLTRVAATAAEAPGKGKKGAKGAVKPIKVTKGKRRH